MILSALISNHWNGYTDKMNERLDKLESMYSTESISESTPSVSVSSESSEVN